MSTGPQPRADAVRRAAIVWATGATAGVSALTLASHFGGLPRLTNMLTGGAPMKVDTAFGLMLAAAALWATTRRPAQASRLAAALALCVIAVGAAGRMSAVAATGLSLLGMGLLLRALRALPAAVAGLALAVGLLAMLALTGYAYDVAALHALRFFQGVALDTAAALALMALGLFVSDAQYGLTRQATSASTTGAMVRRLLPAAIALPFVIAALRTLGERAGLYRPTLGVALVAVTYTIVLTALIWWAGAAVLRMEERRRDAEEALRRKDRLFRLVLDTLPVGVWIAGQDGAISHANPAGQRIGSGAGEAGPGRDGDRAMRRALRGETAVDEVAEIEGGDGGRKTILRSAYPVREDDGAIAGALLVVEDVTVRRRLEAELRQAQKMEAVGTLAGGIAHDFNNLLMVVTGHGEYLLRRMAEGDPNRRRVEDVVKAGERGARLTRQLLAFSRKQVLQPKVVDLNQVVAGMHSLLRRLIGENIDMVAVPGPGLGRVRVDAGQIEQVIMNLAVNARDAMPEGGRITIETANVDCPSLLPGRRCVRLTVSDTGIGMTPETKAHVFDPFFTTKGVGAGTGLGLSTVYGIVEQSQGRVEVESEPGRGATFHVYLPRTDDLPAQAEALPAPAPAHQRRTILLVEDDPALREVVCSWLRGLGYEVLEARHAREALDVNRLYRASIDLLLTDVVMPDVNGLELARRVRDERPAVRVLYMSGYLEEASLSALLQQDPQAILPKPFSAETLGSRLQAVFDGEGAGAQAVLTAAQELRRLVPPRQGLRERRR